MENEMKIEFQTNERNHFSVSVDNIRSCLAFKNLIHVKKNMQ